jgi:N-(2-amino-2-carboxyethyl)-L-glutamate synthase
MANLMKASTRRAAAGSGPNVDGILSAVGNTPLVMLRRLLPAARFELHAKLECLNPGGSAKDRPALNILTRALKQGLVNPGGLVIESSSGNFAVGLAQACVYLGLRLLVVLDTKAVPQNCRILRAYGASISMVIEPDPETGEFLDARLRRVRELLEANPGAFWPNQYANPWNAETHHGTMGEIIDALDRVDYVFCAVSSCGTLRGCSDFLRSRRLDTRIVAVDAVGSVIFGGTPGKRLIPGHGAGRRPELFLPELADDVVQVTDLDCVIGCRRLIRREGILAGGSSGGIASAIERVQHQIPDCSVCVAILPDRGERYLETVYSDDWVREHFGDLAGLEESSWPAAIPAAGKTDE